MLNRRVCWLSMFVVCLLVLVGCVADQDSPVATETAEQSAICTDCPQHDPPPQPGRCSYVLASCHYSWCVECTTSTCTGIQLPAMKCTCGVFSTDPALPPTETTRYCKP